MEETKNTVSMVDMFLHPVFRVQDGIIVEANQPALQRQITIGTSVSTLLSYGKDEYANYQSGCLSVTLGINGSNHIATVLHTDKGDLFHLHTDSASPEMRFMALAAQQLREPLANIMTLTDCLFPSDTIQNDPTAKAQAAQINRSLFQILRSLGNMSDIDTYQRRSDYGMETRNISALFDEIVAKVQAYGDLTNRKIQCESLLNPVYSLVDEQMLERALYNLLSNAIKFSDEGSTITASLTRSGNKLLITVSDDSSTVSNDNIGNMFFRYLREPGIEDSRKGLGLGIPLVQSVASAHGGTLLMDQPEGRGIRFTMTLSIRQNPNANMRSPIMQIDYAGGRDHSLIELSDVLPASAFENTN